MKLLISDILGDPHPMVHFWFGFFLAAMVQAFLKLYVRLIMKGVWNNGRRQEKQRNDIQKFSGILLATPTLALSFVITWITSWSIFGNDHGFWIFWTYVVLLGINAVRLNDYLAARPSRMNLEAFFHKVLWLCVICFFFSAILCYGIISSTTEQSVVSNATTESTILAATTSSMTSAATMKSTMTSPGVTKTVKTTTLVNITTAKSMVLVAGGLNGSYSLSSMEIISDIESQTQLPNLPTEIHGPSMLRQNNTILLCGGANNYQSCIQLNSGSWSHHSSLTSNRWFSSATSTSSASFLFGGYRYNYGQATFEFLQHSSQSQWQAGQTDIPGGGLRFGCAVTISDDQILLIGGFEAWKRILSFNTTTHTFKQLPISLSQGRHRHACVRIPGTEKILVTGGFYYGGIYLDSVELIDMVTGNISNTAPMKVKRRQHGMGIMTFNNEEKVIAFGGWDGSNRLDSIEVYHEDTQTWNLLEKKLSEHKNAFGYLTVRENDIISMTSTMTTPTTTMASTTSVTTCGVEHPSNTSGKILYSLLLHKI